MKNIDILTFLVSSVPYDQRQFTILFVMYTNM